MNNNIHINAGSNYILLTCDGDYEQANFMQFLAKAIAVVRKEKIPKLLIDTRKVTGNFSIIERFDAGVFLSKLVFLQTDPFTIRIAIIANESMIDPNRFGETVAVNRGVQVKVMLDLAEGLEWLEI